MIWPPAKAWTSKSCIDEQFYFVAINYGGKLLNRWVILMSVLDSSVVVKVTWSQLVDSSCWECGWVEIKHIKSYKFVKINGYVRVAEFSHLSNDSGLTIPISKNKIRPWFDRFK